MRIYVLLLLLCIYNYVNAQTENSYRQIYMEAENDYAIGKFEETLQKLNKHIHDFDETLTASAYRLMTLCYLQMDNIAEAKNCASLMLKSNPYYNPTIHDPLRFADIIKALKSGKLTITTASQQAETLEEAPVPVTLITERMIEISGARNLSELLSLYVPSITRIESREENIAMRGIFSTSQENILIMLNGHRLNSWSINSEATDYRINLDKIKQIEVLRGPSSSLYGNVALTAVVNIITKNGKDIDGIHLSAKVGSHNTLSPTLIIGRGGFNWDFMGWSSLYTTDGEKRYLDINDPNNYGLVMKSGNIYLGGYNRKPAYDLGFTFKWNDFSVLFSSQSAKMNTAYNTVLSSGLYDSNKYRLINGVGPGRTRTNTYGELAYDKQLGKWHSNIKVFMDVEQCSYYDVGGDSIPPQYQDILHFADDEVVSHVSDLKLYQRGLYQNESRSGYTIGGSLTFDYKFQLWQNQAYLLMGTQMESFKMHDSNLLVGDDFNRIVVNFSERNRDLILANELNFSGFTQLKTNLGSKIIFNGGFRYDRKKRYNGRFLNAISPRIALVYRAGKESHLRLSYAHSFVDAPYFYRANNILTYSGGSKLDAEHMDGWQLSWMGKKPTYHLNYELNVYYNTLNDLIYYDQSKETDMYSNSGKLRMIGTEGIVTYSKGADYAYLDLSYINVLRSVDYATTGNRIHNIPSISANLTYAHDLFKQQSYGSLTLRANVAVRGSQLSPIIDPFVFKGEHKVYEPDNKLPASCVLNAGINYRYMHWGCDISVYNLLNHDYLQGGTVPFPIPQQRRSFLLKLSYTL